MLDDMRANVAAQDAAVILGLLIAMRREPRLAQTVRQQVIEVKREAFEAVLGRAVERGVAPKTIDRGLLAEVSSALLFSRRDWFAPGGGTLG